MELNMKLIYCFFCLFVLGINTLFASNIKVEHLLINKGYILNFTALDARFEGFVRSTIANEIYEGMDLEVLASKRLETDPIGRYRIWAQFMNPLTNEVFELTSKWMGGDVFSLLVISSSNKIDYKIIAKNIKNEKAAGGGGGYTRLSWPISSWKINFNLEDNSSFIVYFPLEGKEYRFIGTSHGGGYIGPSPGIADGNGMNIDENIFSKGDLVEICAEWPGDKNMKRNFQSYFLIKNITKKTKFKAIGDTRFLEGFGEH